VALSEERAPVASACLSPNERQEGVPPLSPGAPQHGQRLTRASSAFDARPCGHFRCRRQPGPRPAATREGWCSGVKGVHGVRSPGIHGKTAGVDSSPSQNSCAAVGDGRGAAPHRRWSGTAVEAGSCRECASKSDCRMRTRRPTRTAERAPASIQLRMVYWLSCSCAATSATVRNLASDHAVIGYPRRPRRGC
jgi:hypothetical protein